MRPRWTHRPVRFTALRDSSSPASGESGATIIIALLFVTVIMSLTVGLLGFAQVGSRSNRAYKVERTNRYSVEAALNAGIQYLVLNPTVGASGSPDTCHVQVDIEGDVKVVIGGAYFTMDCEATRPSTGGASPTSGQVVDGVQSPRDVTLTIKCGNDGANPVQVGWADCGTGTTVDVAVARVRFDRDTSPAIDKTKSAIVPKILSWELRKNW
jgi:hypothetical protein